MKNVLVTGGGGFIGRNLILALLKDERYNITCLDQRMVDFYPPCVRCIQGTFSDRNLLQTLLAGIDVVVHLGSNALPANSDYVTDVEQNLLGSITLIKECENAKVRKIVFSSSGGTIYGPDAVVPTPENSPRNPICSYGIIKVAVENYLKLASRLTGIQTLTLRIANPYGPWQNWNSAQGAIAIFCHKIIAGEPISLFGDGSIARDFVYINDVIEAFVGAIEAPVLTESCNIGSGECHSMLDIIRLIEQVSGQFASIQTLPSRGCDVPRSFLDIKHVGRVLSWHPKTALKDGIAATIKWQKENSNAF